jgi:hypothetical protein
VRTRGCEVVAEAECKLDIRNVRLFRDRVVVGGLAAEIIISCASTVMSSLLSLLSPAKSK